MSKYTVGAPGQITDFLQPMMTLEEVAVELSKETGKVVTRQAVSQTERRAFHKIRKYFRKHRLDVHDFLTD